VYQSYFFFLEKDYKKKTMPRCNSSIKRFKNHNNDNDNSNSGYEDDIENSTSENMIQKIQRAKSYPEELLRESMKEKFVIHEIVVQQETDVDVDDGERDEVLSESKENYMRLAIRGHNTNNNSNNSNNNKRLKSCGQMQSALVTMAIQDGDADQLWRLLSRKDVDVTETDGAGMQPIHYACLFGNVEMLTILLKHKAEIINNPDENGELPLDIAVREGNFEIAQYLVKQGAKVKSIVNGMIDGKDNRKGSSPRS